MATSTLTYTGTLGIEVCCWNGCGVTFGMPVTMQKQRLDDHRGFYCPNGHQQFYFGKSDEEKLRDQLEVAQRRVINERQWRVNAEAATERERRSAIAYKGHLTRMRKMVAAGVCPVMGCHRNFANVRGHMARMHPDFHIPTDTELTAGEQS
jgi:hypothetical protein